MKERLVGIMKNCEKCKKIIENEIYNVLTNEVGNRNDKFATEAKIKGWDKLEDERGVILCEKCSLELEKIEKDLVDLKERKESFFKLLFKKGESDFERKSAKKL